MQELDRGIFGTGRGQHFTLHESVLQSILFFLVTLYQPAVVIWYCLVKKATSEQQLSNITQLRLMCDMSLNLKLQLDIVLPI